MTPRLHRLPQTVNVLGSMHLWVYTNNTHTLVLKLHAMLDMLLLLLKHVIGILSTAFVFSVLGVMQVALYQGSSVFVVMAGALL